MPVNRVANVMVEMLFSDRVSSREPRTPIVGKHTQELFEYP